MPHLLASKRRALMPDGEPHPFIWYGHGSRWVEHTFGVFDAVTVPDHQHWACWLYGCRWLAVMHDYPEAAHTALVSGFMPPVTLRCQQCGCEAVPWRFWPTYSADSSASSPGD